MSKLENLRCDICGKTYLSDEAKNDIILCTSGDNGMAYNDICPACENNIHNVINEPELIDTLILKHNNKNHDLNTLQEKINNLRTSLHIYYPGRLLNNFWKIDDYVKMLDLIYDNYNDKCNKLTQRINDIARLTKSCTLWRNISFGLIGFSAVLLIKLIFG